MALVARLYIRIEPPEDYSSEPVWKTVQHHITLDF